MSEFVKVVIANIRANMLSSYEKGNPNPQPSHKRGRFAHVAPKTQSSFDFSAIHAVACWCGLDQDCHVDVYLEIANSPCPSGAAKEGGKL